MSTYSKRDLSDSVVYSNISFLVPLVMLEGKNIVYSLIILGVFIFSSLLHLSGETRFRRTDKIFALLLICYNLFIFSLSGFNTSYFFVAIIASTFAFYFYQRSKHNYDINHSLWHVFSSIITLSAVLTA